AKDMQVNRTRADGTAARQRDLTLTKTRHQRAQRPDGSTHGFHQIVWGRKIVNVAGIDPDGTVTLHFSAQLGEQLHGRVDIFQLRYVLDLYRLFREQRSEKNWQRGVFRARNCDFALETRWPLYTKFIHVFALL